MAISGRERAHLRFAIALHRAVADAGVSSCFAPYSVASALGLVARGARGTTADELTALLAGDAGSVVGQAELLADAANLEAGSGEQQPELAVSNTLWAWDGLPVNDTYRAELARWPAGAIASAPFRDDPEGARQLINADVGKATKGLIQELLPPGTVDPDTVATLVNALYLRVGWVLPFQRGQTAEDDFHTAIGTVRVPMMRQREQLGYAAARGWQVVTLPAAGGVQGVVLLPDAPLDEQEARLDDALLAELLSGTKSRLVELTMPKLELNVQSPLRPALTQLGVRTLFTGGADLSGISQDDRLRVSSVRHQAVLRVDEDGLEGAAATAAVMRLVSVVVDEPVPVQVDRPFLFLVRHAGTGAVYFMARVARP